MAAVSELLLLGSLLSELPPEVAGAGTSMTSSVKEAPVSVDGVSSGAFD